MMIVVRSNKLIHECDISKINHHIIHDMVLRLIVKEITSV